MPHIALLGDSIFDNAAYVPGGPDVVAQLRGMLPTGWSATLLAVDGAVIDGVARQLSRLPPDATHLVVSAGGNDALGHADLLDRRATSSPQVLGWLADAAAGFERRYRAMLDAVSARGLPVIDLRLVCTEPADYANPIEPSVQGGRKIAAAIAGAIVGSA